MELRKQNSVFSHIKDLPNICSLLGLMCTVTGIYFAIIGSFQLAIIGLLWAVLFDWYDGIIARKLKGRTKAQGQYGAQLDSMIDIVSFGVLPAILLLSYSNYNIWFLPGAFIAIAASAIRLSYFNVYGLLDSNTYKGFPMDNNGLVVSFLFLFESFFDSFTFSIIIYVVLLLLAGLNLSSIPTPKLGGKWVYVLIIYVLVLTSIYSFILSVNS